MSMEEGQPYQPGGDAAQRVSAPAICLIIVGVLDVFIGGYWVFQGLTNRGDVEKEKQKFREEMKRNEKEMTEEQKKQMEAVSGFVEKIFNLGPAISIGLGVAALAIGVLVIAGGAQMKSLKMRGLAITGSIVSMIPCISPCCILGIPFGIWSLVVLSNPEVKAAFR